jgi:hypothetical protein
MKAQQASNRHLGQLTTDFTNALLADFQKHGADTISRVGREHQSEYLRLLASIAPKQVAVAAGQPPDGDQEALLAAMALVTLDQAT